MRQVDWSLLHSQNCDTTSLEEFDGGVPVLDLQGCRIVYWCMLCYKLGCRRVHLSLPIGFDLYRGSHSFRFISFGSVHIKWKTVATCLYFIIVRNWVRANQCPVLNVFIAIIKF